MNGIRWARGRLEFLLPVLVAAVIMTIDPNPEFYRDEDYEYLYQAAAFARAIATLWRGVEAASDWAYQAAIFVHSLLFYRHGPLPALYVGLAYALLDTLGVDMTAIVFQAVTAALGVGTVLAFHAMLRAVGVSRALACAGATMLALSPLIVGLGRGLHTFAWLWIPFGQAISVLCLQRFLDGSGSAWTAGIAVANALLGDQLFFLTLPLLIAAVAARDVSLNAPAGVLAALRRGAAMLMRPGFVIPVLGALALIVLSALAWVRLSSALAGTIPMSTLAYALLRRGGDIGQATREMPWLQATLLLGEAVPLLVAAAVAGLILRPPVRPGFALLFALGGTLGFGGIFFLAWPATANEMQTHQSYVLVPLLTLVLLQLERFSSAMPRLVFVATAAGAVGCLATTLGLVWMLPTTLQRRVQDVGDFGVRKPLFGTTAAGFLVRDEVARLGGRLVGTALSVVVHPGRDDAEIVRWGGFRNWSSPFLLFAGVQQRGDWHAARVGAAVAIDYRIEDHRPASGAGADCATILCATIALTPEDDGSVRRVTLRDGERALATLTFIGFPKLATQAVLDVNSAPARQPQALADLFPERPPVRRGALVAALSTRFFR